MIPKTCAQFHLTLRPATKEDYDFVLALIKKTLWPHLKAFVKPAEHVFKEGWEKDWKNIHILMKEKPIGVVEVERKQGMLFLNKIFLIPEYQGKGVGKSIIKELQKEGKPIELEVWENNPAVAFYKKMGFKEKEKKKHKLVLVYG